MKGKNHSGKSVFVALSGGVDSAVAAVKLQEQGYDVVGVYMKTWAPPGYPCPWKEEKRDAARVCAVLRIPFVMWDFTNEYKQKVVDYMIEEYACGRTPNPDVMCNKEIKFGMFFNEALKHGADYIATGHYIRKSVTRDSKFVLRRARAHEKDQSYFLWTLTQGHLSRTLFPIGEFTLKDDVRTYARAKYLPVADKKDSQGICFIGPLDMNEFLREYIPSHEGPICTTAGKTVGAHDGLPFYTIGQRQGVEAGGSTPHYVVEKQYATNTLVVAPPAQEEMLMSKELTATNLNWIGDAPKSGTLVDVQIRYRQNPVKARIEKYESRIKVMFEEPVRAVTPGQSVVFYKKDQVLGGGVIEKGI